MASSEVIRTRRFPISINSSISSEYQRIKLTGHSLNGSAENSHEKNNNRRGRQTNGSFEGNGFCRYQCKKYGEAGTRDHILAVMKELNFRPKGVARNLKNGNQDKSIGIIIKDLNYPFYTSIAAGA